MVDELSWGAEEPPVADEDSEGEERTLLNPAGQELRKAMDEARRVGDMVTDDNLSTLQPGQASGAAAAARARYEKENAADEGEEATVMRPRPDFEGRRPPRPRPSDRGSSPGDAPRTERSSEPASVPWKVPPSSRQSQPAPADEPAKASGPDLGSTVPSAGLPDPARISNRVIDIGDDSLPPHRRLAATDRRLAAAAAGAVG